MKTRTFVSLVGGVPALLGASLAIAVTAPTALAGARGDRLVVVDIPASKDVPKDVSITGTNGFGNVVSTPTYKVTSSTFDPSALANWSWEGQVKVVVSPPGADSPQQTLIGYCDMPDIVSLRTYTCTPTWKSAREPAPAPPKTTTPPPTTTPAPPHPAAPPSVRKPLQAHNRWVSNRWNSIKGDINWSTSSVRISGAVKNLGLGSEVCFYAYGSPAGAAGIVTQPLLAKTCRSVQPGHTRGFDFALTSGPGAKIAAVKIESIASPRWQSSPRQLVLQRSPIA